MSDMWQLGVGRQGGTGKTGVTHAIFVADGLLQVALETKVS